MTLIKNHITTVLDSVNTLNQKGLYFPSSIIPLDPETDLSLAMYFKGGGTIQQISGATRWDCEIDPLKRFTIYNAGGTPIIADYSDFNNGIKIVNHYKFWDGLTDSNNWLFTTSSDVNYSNIFGGDFTFFSLTTREHKGFSDNAVDECYFKAQNNPLTYRIMALDRELTNGLLVEYRNNGIILSVQTNDVTYTENFIFLAFTFNSTSKTLTVFSKGVIYTANDPTLVIPDWLHVYRPNIAGYDFSNFPIRGETLEKGAFNREFSTSEINSLIKFFSDKYGYTPLYY